MNWISALDRLPQLGQRVLGRYAGRLTFRGTRLEAPRLKAHLLFQSASGGFLALTPGHTEWQPDDDPSPIPACDACGRPSGASPRGVPPYLCEPCAVREAALRAAGAEF